MRGPQMYDNMSDSQFVDLSECILSHDLINMTDHERSIVELHDQLNEIRLERTLLNVQLLNTSPGDIHKEEFECLR